MELKQHRQTSKDLHIYTNENKNPSRHLLATCRSLTPVFFRNRCSVYLLHNNLMHTKSKNKNKTKTKNTGRKINDNDSTLHSKCFYGNQTTFCIDFRHWKQNQGEIQSNKTTFKAPHYRHFILKQHTYKSRSNFRYLKRR